ncbi:MAG: response regulator, partial [Chloroflexaceae bacterium]|nr:response regulator [Chloroflexaceae bacterium]
MFGHVRAATLLLVDGEVERTTRLAALLQQWGYQVHTAATAATALATLATMQPDVLLLAARLPDGDGPTLLAAIRQQ